AAAAAAAGPLSAAYPGFTVIPGAELTHVPPSQIPALIRRARDLGSRLVVVHGESPAEPVEPGTNLAAIEGGCDILAHPGFITEEEARLAAARGVFLELSARGGHSLANGHVAKLALRAGAALLVNSDAHAPGDLLTADYRRKTAIGAGLSEGQYLTVLKAARDLALRLAGGPAGPAAGPESGGGVQESFGGHGGGPVKKGGTGRSRKREGGRPDGP
ncbi:MAG: histidinol phosphate phosphatase domain-containing protein, partial [Deltaproteobacteria bacterium]|nr:histidinol phosphate phosphatase domain-containing protein [Deltaproteobacteria bacterium]